MANTATTVLDRIRIRFGDPSANFITSANGVAWLNQALDQVMATVLPHKRLKGFSVVANQDSFVLPSDAIMMELLYHNKTLRNVVERKTRQEFFERRRVIDGASGDYPVIWTELEDRVYIWPRYSAASATSTASGAIDSATTTISVSTITGLSSAGRVKVNSEEIEYTSTATGQLKGAVRGVGGTTAASHASGDAFTQQDLLMLYRRQHASIGTGAESVDAPLYMEPALEDYALYLAHLAEGNDTRAKQAYELFQAKMEKIEYAAGREHLAGPLYVRNVR